MNATAEAVSEEMPSVFTYDEDVSQAEAPPPLPVGAYIAEVTSSILKNSAKGNLNLVLGFKIDADQYPADFKDGNPDGTTLTHYTSVANDQPSKFRMKNFTEALGITVRKDLDVASFMGARARVNIVHELWDGLMRPKIKSVESAE